MKAVETLKRGVRKVGRLWKDGQFGRALAEVESLLGRWPDNPRLLVMRAQLIQLQDDETGLPTLDDARADLTRASDLDETSPDPLIELGHFCYVHHDSAQEAAKYFEKAVHLSVDLLTQALVGQAEALSEMGQGPRASAALMTACSLAAQFRGDVRGNVLARIKELVDTTLAASPATANGSQKS